MANIDLPASDEELKHHVTAPAHCENLWTIWRPLTTFALLLQTKEASLTLAAYDVAKQVALENVLYIEVRLPQKLSMDQGLTVPETIDVCEGLRQAQDEFGIIAKALVCGMRQSDQELTSHILAEANQVRDQDFVGFDFAGDEHHSTSSHWRPSSQQVKVTTVP